MVIFHGRSIGACCWGWLWTMAVATVIVAGVGCPQRGPLVPSARVDLAVGDAGNTFDVGKQLPYPQLLLYFDALNSGARPQPDVVLSGDALPIYHPDSIVFAEGDLYVGDSVGGAVFIWRDYRSIDDNQAPDVTLGIGAGIERPAKIAIEDDTLIVLETESNSVLLFRDLSELTSSSTPDVVLDNIGNARGMAVGEDAIYVASFSLVGESEQGKVSVFYGLADLESGDPRSAVLTGASFLDQSFVWPTTMAVFNNHLFVFGSVSFQMFVFSPADDLTNEQAPEAVLGGSATGALAGVTAMAAIGDSLFVANSQFAQDLGVAAYRPLTQLEAGQAPFALLDGSRSLVRGANSVSTAGGALFVSTSYAAQGDVQVFRNARLLHDGDRADIVLANGDAVLAPVAVAAQDVSSK